MSWWRKTSPSDTGSHNVNGWVKLQSIWRKSGAGELSVAQNGWIKIKSIWRHEGGGLWTKIFGAGFPYINAANPPTLYFVDQNGFETTDSPFNGMKLYLTRGMWEEDPTEFTMSIEKSSSPYTTWENFESTPYKKIYTDYDDADYTYQFPASVSSRPSISKTNVRNKIKFRGKILAKNGEGTTTFTTPELAARLWFSINTFEITDETATTITFSWSYNDILPVDIPVDIWNHQIQLYNSLNEPILPVPEVAYLYDTSITINKPADLDPEETYQWELEAIADDYYREFTGTPYSENGPTAEYSYIEWMPGEVVEDPEVTFSARTVSGFTVNWFSSNAERYEVDIYDAITANSIFGYPKITEDLSAVVFGLTEGKLMTVSVKGLSGTQNQNESNDVVKSIRTLNIGIEPVLSDAYDQSADSYKVLIENYSDIDDFDIQVDTTNGNATRSADIVTVSDVDRSVSSCVTVTSSKIDNVNLTAQSYDIASSQKCATLGTWYCVQYVNTTPVTCSTFESFSDVSGTNSFTSTACYTTPSCCPSTEYGEWSEFTSCVNGKRSRTRTKTVNNLNCTSETLTETEEVDCWYCTTSVPLNCAGCTQTIESSNISGTGSGYNTSCSQTTYPNCQTACVCNSTEENKCTAWSCEECTGSTRTCTRTCPTGSPCATTKTEDCWYCTTSVPENCAGCSNSISSTNVSGTGSGYNTTCSQSGYPNCQTACVCTSTLENQCGSWTYSACSGNPPTRTKTRTCPSGSPCSTSVTEPCWYCTTSVPENCAGCSTSIQSSNVSGTGSGYNTTCSQSGYPNCQTPCACTSTLENQCGSWSNFSACTGNPPTRTRTRTCPSGSPCATTDTQQCWYCTTSVQENCAGCSTSIQSSNVSGTGSGYNTTCSQSGYPGCQTPCVCNSLKEADCGDWVLSQDCTGSPPQRTYIRTCPSGSPCSTSKTEPCWYCTTSVPTNCAGCSTSIQSSNISGSGSGYSIACSQTAYPTCQTPCAQWWCKTQTQGGGCALSGPFSSSQAGSGTGYVTICSTGDSNPYSCVEAPYFPFFPPFFPFFPPYFAPSPYFPFFPPFFPFFPPFFPFFPPYFAAPPYFPFFPPYFPFFPPFFKGSKCLEENTLLLTDNGYVKAKELSMFDKVYTIDPSDISYGDLDNANISIKSKMILVDIIKIKSNAIENVIKFNDMSTLISENQPVFYEQSHNLYSYKDAKDIIVGDTIVKIDESGNLVKIKVDSVTIVPGSHIVYDIKTAKWPWYITKDMLVIS